MSTMPMSLYIKCRLVIHMRSFTIPFYIVMLITVFYQGMYPTVIILLVSLQKLHLECGFNNFEHKSLDGPLASIHFASPVSYSSNCSTRSPDEIDSSEGKLTVQEIRLAPEGSLASSFGLSASQKKAMVEV
jgi:hypothetical protein